MDEQKTVYFVERLNLLAAARRVIPFVWQRPSGRVPLIYYFEGSVLGIFLTRLLTGWRGSSVQYLSFRAIDLKNTKGEFLRYYVAHEAYAKLHAAIKQNPVFQRFLTIRDGSMAAFFEKELAFSDYISHDTVYRALLLIEVTAWKRRQSKLFGRCVLCINARRWFQELEQYARSNQIELLAVPSFLSIKAEELFRYFLKERFWWIKTIYYSFRQGGVKQALRYVFGRANKPPSYTNARIAVPSYGHLNLEVPEHNSDVFFWHQSDLKGRDLLLTFRLYKDPLTPDKYGEIQRHAMEAVVLTPSASRCPRAPFFYFRPCSSPLWKKKYRALKEHSLPGAYRRWGRGRMLYYDTEVDYWRDFFRQYHVKVSCSWYKAGEEHCLMAEAMRQLGGVTTLYQRSLEVYPTPEMSVFSDIYFSFSAFFADLERRQGSVIPYHVVTGYFGDYRIPLLRSPAQELRRKLFQSGARFIIAYFDEYSLEDTRMDIGHDINQENYRFLLENVLRTPSWGLILKPKMAKSLRARLGPVASLLKELEATGRCVILGDEQKRFGFIPVSLAALAADVAIHGHMYAATAGFESALTGTPTLLLDREGVPQGILHQLEQGRVIFRDWPHLWAACRKYQQKARAIPGFGDWSAVLPQLDPFRDGRAAERIGTYLKWLIDGYQSGWDKARIMEAAADRYKERWGQDKVLCVYYGAG